MRGLPRVSARDVDRRASDEFGIPSICLMENAGAGAARLALGLLGTRSGPVVCVAGSGNNGGDALVVARHLALEGRRVHILRALSDTGRSLPPDSAVQVAIVTALGLPVDLVPSDTTSLEGALLRVLGRAALIVDGVLGTGLTSTVRGCAALLVDAINATGAPVLALDLPSGMDCDTGEPLGACVRATATATFVAPKLGFANPGARRWTGDVHVVGIGAPLDWPPADAASADDA